MLFFNMVGTQKSQPKHKKMRRYIYCICKEVSTTITCYYYTCFVITFTDVYQTTLQLSNVKLLFSNNLYHDVHSV